MKLDIWDLRTLKRRATAQLTPVRGQIPETLVILPEAKQAVAITSDDTVEFFDLSSGKSLRSVTCRDTPNAISSDGKQMFCTRFRQGRGFIEPCIANYLLKTAEI